MSNQIELTPALLADLRKKAEAIDSQRRIWKYAMYSGYVETVDELFTVCDPYDSEYASFIPSANPAVVLALVAEVERLRAAQCWVVKGVGASHAYQYGPFFTKDGAERYRRQFNNPQNYYVAVWDGRPNGGIDLEAKDGAE